MRVCACAPLSSSLKIAFRTKKLNASALNQNHQKFNYMACLNAKGMMK